MFTNVRNRREREFSGISFEHESILVANHHGNEPKKKRRNRKRIAFEAFIAVIMALAARKAA